MDHATHTNLSRPHGEEARSAVSNHEAAPSFETAASRPPQDEADRDLRAASNLLCLWGLCGKASCRRAKACKQNADDCLARYAPLVPEEARFGAAAMLMGKRDGVSYEVVRMHAPGEIAAIESWIGLVHAAARAP